MLPNTPTYLHILFLLLVLCTAAYVIIGLRSVETRMPNGLRNSTYPLTIAALLIAWLAVTGYLAWSGFIARFDTLPPRFAIGPLGGSLALLYVIFSRNVGKRLDVMPPAWLVNLQTMRVGVELTFFGLFVAGVGPRLMTFEGRNFDILIGLTAPVAAYFGFRGTRWRIGTMLLWNLAGIMILSFTIGHGIFSAPTAFQRISTDPPNIFMGYFPYFWVPAFLAPLALILHAASIRQLLRKSR